MIIHIIQIFVRTCLTSTTVLLVITIFCYSCSCSDLQMKYYIWYRCLVYQCLCHVGIKCWERQWGRVTDRLSGHHMDWMGDWVSEWSPHGWVTERSPHGWVTERSPHGWVTERSPHGWVTEQSPHGWVTEWSPHGWVTEQSPHGWVTEWSPHGWVTEWSPHGWMNVLCFLLGFVPAHIASSVKFCTDYKRPSDDTVKL